MSYWMKVDEEKFDKLIRSRDDNDDDDDGKLISSYMCKR